MAIAIGAMQDIALEVRTHGGQIVPVTNGMEVMGRNGVSKG